MSQNFVQQKHSKLNISAHGIGLNLKLNFPLQKLKNARKRIESKETIPQNTFDAIFDLICPLFGRGRFPLWETTDFPCSSSAKIVKSYSLSFSNMWT